MSSSSILPMHNMLFVQYDSPVSATLIPDVNTELYLIMQDRPSYSLEFTFPQISCFPSNRTSWDNYMLNGILRHEF